MIPEFFLNYAQVGVFIMMIINSIPFIGMILPEELILSIVFTLDNSYFYVASVFFASVLGMLVGQTIIYYLALNYGQKFINRLGIDGDRYNKITKFLEKASLFDQILLRISTNSIFRIIAAAVAGFTKMSFRRHLILEIISSVLKTAMFFVLSLFILTLAPDGNIENIIVTIGVALLLVTLISLAFSFGLKRRLE